MSSTQGTAGGRGCQKPRRSPELFLAEDTHTRSVSKGSLPKEHSPSHFPICHPAREAHTPRSAASDEQAGKTLCVLKQARS